MNVVDSGAGTNGPHHVSRHESFPGSGAVPEGFLLDQLDDRWALLRHQSCQKSIKFVSPTTGRVGWYVRSHICGPIGTSWDERASAYYPHETCALVRYLSWLVSATEPKTFADPACKTAVREAIDVLRAILVAAEKVQAR